MIDEVGRWFSYPQAVSHLTEDAELFHVTHWMELPTKPEGVKNDPT